MSNNKKIQEAVNAISMAEVIALQAQQIATGARKQLEALSSPAATCSGKKILSSHQVGRILLNRRKHLLNKKSAA